jgi:hypothetical protein
VTFLLQGDINVKSGFVFCFDRFIFKNNYITLNVSIKDEAVTTQRVAFVC